MFLDLDRREWLLSVSVVLNDIVPSPSPSTFLAEEGDVNTAL